MLFWIPPLDFGPPPPPPPQQLIICFQYYLSTVNHVPRPEIAVSSRGLLPGGSLGIARGCMIGTTIPFSQGNAVARWLGTFGGQGESTMIRRGGGGGGGRGRVGAEGSLARHTTYTKRA